MWDVGCAWDAAATGGTRDAASSCGGRQGHRRHPEQACQARCHQRRVVAVVSTALLPSGLPQGAITQGGACRMHPAVSPTTHPFASTHRTLVIAPHGALKMSRHQASGHHHATLASTLACAVAATTIATASAWPAPAGPVAAGQSLQTAAPSVAGCQLLLSKPLIDIYTDCSSLPAACTNAAFPVYRAHAAFVSVDYQHIRAAHHARDDCHIAQQTSDDIYTVRAYYAAILNAANGWTELVPSVNYLDSPLPPGLVRTWIIDPHNVDKHLEVTLKLTQDAQGTKIGIGLSHALL